MSTKRDLTGKKGEPASVRGNQLGERRGQEGPSPDKSRERREKISRDDDQDEGIHDA